MKYMTTRWVSMGTGIMMLAGCMALKSTRIDPTKTKDKITAEERRGIAYSLPYAKVNVKALREGEPTNNPPPYYQVTIQAIYEPDPKYMFLLNPSLRCLSDDSYRIEVTNGLLSTISSTNADKSGEVLIDLAKVAIESFKLAAGVPVSAQRLGAGPDYPKEIEFTFDPSSTCECERARRHFGKWFELKVDRPKPEFGAWAELKEATNGQRFDGFFYRSVLPYQISLSNRTERSSVSKNLLLPNGAPILSWSPRRAALVQCVNHVTLENGTLKEVYVEKPSTALATVKVPLTILQAVVALPTDLIQLKLNYSSTNESLLKSQQAEIEAMQALLEAQRNLLARTNQNPSPPVSSSTKP